MEAAKIAGILSLVGDIAGFMTGGFLFTHEKKMETPAPYKSATTQPGTFQSLRFSVASCSLPALVLLLQGQRANSATGGSASYTVRVPDFWITLSVLIVEGLLLGSFLNVCIFRIPRGESVVKPRSHCTSCGSTVRWYDNVPIASFLILRGRCRDCQERFSWRYPAVELAMAGWSLIAFFGTARLLVTSGDVDGILLSLVHGASTVAFGFVMLGLMIMDLQTGLLPNEFTIGGICTGLFFAGAESFWVPSVRYKTFFTPEEVFFGRRLGAAIAGFLLLWLIERIYFLLRHRRGMGAGDAKMLATIGAFLGFANMGVALFCGIVLAGLAGIAVLLAKRGNGSTRLPFGSFLALGGLIAAVSGDRILHWYTGLFR